MKILSILILSFVLLTGCTNTNDNHTYRHFPFQDVKEQPEPEDIIRHNPLLTDKEWAKEWYNTISAHENYLRNYIHMLVVDMGINKKSQCNVENILKDIKEPSLPVLNSAKDTDEINLILAKSVRTIYDSYVSLIESLKDCK